MAVSYIFKSIEELAVHFEECATKLRSHIVKEPQRSHKRIQNMAEAYGWDAAAHLLRNAKFEPKEEGQ